MEVSIYLVAMASRSAAERSVGIGEVLLDGEILPGGLAPPTEISPGVITGGEVVGGVGGANVEEEEVVVVDVEVFVDVLVSHAGGDNPKYLSLQASCMNCILVCFLHLARLF